MGDYDSYPSFTGLGPKFLDENWFWPKQGHCAFGGIIEAEKRKIVPPRPCVATAKTNSSSIICRAKKRSSSTSRGWSRGLNNKAKLYNTEKFPPGFP